MTPATPWFVGCLVAIGQLVPMAFHQAVAAGPVETLEIALVKNGQPVHNMYCLPNDQADPAAVLALKEYRELLKRATGVEPVRVAQPEPDRPTIFFGRNPWSDQAGVTAAGLAPETPPKAFGFARSVKTFTSSGATRPKWVPTESPAASAWNRAPCLAPMSSWNVTTACCLLGTMIWGRSRRRKQS